MIPPELEAEIRRLYFAEHWQIGTIASQHSLHHSVVRRVVGLPRPSKPSSPRSSMIEPYLDFVRETWEQYPALTASRLHAMCRERGYPGHVDHFRVCVRDLRPKKRSREAFLRRTVLPGEEGQVDWAHFGKVQIGRALRPLMAFVLLLSYSRHVFLRFFMDARLGSFLTGHREAFDHFGAVPRRMLTDNLKSVVLHRVGTALEIHPAYRELADHYRFQIQPVAPYRGNEKGRVERAIRWCRSAFFAARSWRDLDDLNDQARRWTEEQARSRRWPDDRDKTVAEAFAEERPYLLALPGAPFPSEERRETRVGKTPYVRFDANDYSVPPSLVQEMVTIYADDRRIRIVHDGQEVARHPRCFDRGQVIEDEEHLALLRQLKRSARRHQATHRLVHAAPSVQRLLNALCAQKRPLGTAVSQLLALLQRFGARRLEKAVVEVLERGTPHLAAVRQVLEREDDPAPLPVSLPDDPRIQDLVVRPHSLHSYDTLAAADDVPADPSAEQDDDDEEAGELAPAGA